MDGSLAVLFFVASLSDMWLVHCNDDCLKEKEVDHSVSMSLGKVLFQGETIGDEIYFRFSADRKYGPYQPIAGISVTETKDLWFGVGASYRFDFIHDKVYLELSFMPGLYIPSGGPDLGYPLEFRSGIEMGWNVNEQMNVGAGFDHRSNGEIGKLNPGLETYYLNMNINY